MTPIYARAEPTPPSKRPLEGICPSLSLLEGCVGGTVRCNQRRGMTFIEMLVWISVFLAAMWAIVGSILSFYRANTYTLEQAQAVSEARRGIENVVHTIREANYGSDGAYPIIAMSTSSLTFYADIDSDPFLEKVRFFIQGTDLKQGVIDPSGDPPVYTALETITTVSAYVRNNMQGINEFQFYNASGTPIVDMSRVTDVRFVRLDTVVNVSPEKLPNELTLRSSATLRNLR
ncbi:type II secretion system protein [Candidatus Kaiserbacteria bacterium]|nr:type II secretion system protein [Candidatus Kaiserbacteria bacterium]